MNAALTNFTYSEMFVVHRFLSLSLSNPLFNTNTLIGHTCHLLQQQTETKLWEIQSITEKHV